MPRLHPEDFGSTDMARLCAAISRAEAAAVEAVLDTEGVEYTFEISEISKSSPTIFGNVRNGVVFLVPGERLAECRGLIERAGLAELLVY